MFAKQEAATGVHWLRTLGGFKLDEETATSDDGKKEITVRYTPLGPAVGIVPWNFPIHLMQIFPSLKRHYTY